MGYRGWVPFGGVHTAGAHILYQSVADAIARLTETLAFTEHYR
jgi:hypothetical protein